MQQVSKLSVDHLLIKISFYFSAGALEHGLKAPFIHPPDELEFLGQRLRIIFSHQPAGITGGNQLGNSAVYGRKYRNTYRHRLHQRHRDTLHVAIGTGDGRQQEHVSFIEHRFHLMAGFKSRHLHAVFQLILLDQST